MAINYAQLMKYEIPLLVRIAPPTSSQT